MTTPLIAVDTDVGLGTPGAEIDDGAALIALLKSGTDVRCASSVYGNVQGSEATKNLCRLLSFLGREDIAIGQGAELPLVQDPSWFESFRKRYGPTPPWRHQPELPTAAQLLIDTIRSNPRQLTILALGPLTSLALAVRLAPDIVRAVREVVCMGGSAENSAVAEFNIRCDPEAAHIVFQAGWPLRLIGLDVTRRIHFARELFAELPDDEPALQLLKQQAPGWIDTVEEHGWDRGGCALHDAVAVAAVLNPALFEFVTAKIDVERSDIQRRGQTRVQQVLDGASSTQVAVDVDVSRCRQLIWSLLKQGPR